MTTVYATVVSAAFPVASEAWMWNVCAPTPEVSIAVPLGTSPLHVGTGSTSSAHEYCAVTVRCCT